MSRTVIDEIRAHAATRPDHPALIVEGRDQHVHHIAYAELVGRVEARAAALSAAGVGAGDRCGLIEASADAFIEAALGILAAGACMVPIPDGTSDDALAQLAGRASLHHVWSEGTLESRGAVEPVDDAGDAAFRALRPAYLRFTSGTTHERKGVVIGHAAVLERLANANQGLGIGPSDRVLWVLPLAHHFVVSILLYLRFGASVLLPASSLARPLLDFALAQRASVLYASPYHYLRLAREPSERRLDAVRLAISTAEGLRSEVAQSFRERYDLPLAQALGIIEVGLPVVNLARPDKSGALGQPLPAYQIWLRDEDGKPLSGPGSPERTGEICIRGSGLFDAYLRPWLPASRVLEPDGFRTGDQGWFDADGDLYLTGRRTNRINMAGMKFFAEEVEAVLDAHPGVRESRVHARTHAHLGEIPMAEIVAAGASAPTPAELLAWCRERLEAYKIPRAFEVVEALPHTATGKLQRWDGSAA